MNCKFLSTVGANNGYAFVNSPVFIGFKLKFTIDSANIFLHLEMCVPPSVCKELWEILRVNERMHDCIKKIITLILQTNQYALTQLISQPSYVYVCVCVGLGVCVCTF